MSSSPTRPLCRLKAGSSRTPAFQVQSKRSEVLFVDYIAEHLTPNGRAAIVVPEGIIFQSQSAYVALRKMLVDNHLAAVISLPAGVFNPYSGVKTSILILDRAVAKASKHVAFFKIENDGFALGAQRKAVKGSQLAQVKAELGAWFYAARAGAGDVLDSDLGFAIPRDEVAAGGEYVLSGERYKSSDAKTSHWPLIPIGDLCDLINGRAFKPDDWENADGGGLPIIRIQNLNNPTASFNYYSGEVRDRFIVETGDLLFSWSGSRGTSFGAHLWKGPRAILNQHIFNVKFDDTRADKMYLLRILNAVVDQVEDNLHGGVGLVHITKGNLEKIEIPLPPLEVQREIVAEVEGYQRVIDGARAVLANYRPHIPIDPEWTTADLKTVVGFQEGPGILAKDFVSTGVPLIRLSGLQGETATLEGCNFLDPEKVEQKWSHFKLNVGDILISTSASFGRVSVVGEETENAICYTGIIRFWPKGADVSQGYLRVFLGSKNFQDQAASFASGAVIKHFGPTHLKKMKIPIPPIEVQEKIAADIEAEQAIIDGNRDLVARFEKKIDAAIARTWGDAKCEAAN
jgi:type I restriction enzyme M protein